MSIDESHDYSVGELESLIRDHITAPHKQSELLKNLENWHSLCSALDAIGDAETGLDSYLKMSEITDIGELYVVIYGVLQLLYVEQDATKTLHNALGLPYEAHDDVKEVRDIRNCSIGHPTGDHSGGSHFIARAFMSKTGFRLHSSWPKEQRHEFKDINIIGLIAKQRDALKMALKIALKRLEEDEMAHKEQFKDQKLADSFHASTDWMIRKLFEAIWTADLFPLGAPHVEILKGQVDKFESGLSERGLPDVANYQISKIRYAFAELKRFFTSDPESKLSSDDAEIFVEFVQQKTAELQKIAAEIDAGYAVEMKKS